MWFTGATERHYLSPWVTVGGASRASRGSRVPDDRPEAQTGSDGALDGPVEHPDAQELTFPDLPRLELDQLLGQLVERAQEVMATQGRLRGLLRANQMITGDLALPVVLRRIVEAARELVGARYAALGVHRAGRRPGRVRARRHARGRRRRGSGTCPQGKGLLGALIDDPRPIRLRAHRRRPPLLGLPARAPADGQLPRRADPDPGRGVRQPLPRREHPGRVQRRGRGAGHRRSPPPPRSRSTTPGSTSRPHPRRVAAGLRRDHRGVLSAEPGDAGGRCSSSPSAAADSPTPTSSPSCCPTRRRPEPADRGRRRRRRRRPHRASRVPLNGSLSGQVFTHREAAAADVAGRGSRRRSAVAGRRSTSAPCWPCRCAARDRVHGVLSAGPAAGPAGVHRRGRSTWPPASPTRPRVAIELAEARAEQQRAAMLDERERIAADLHDHVIQRLFAAGLSLQSTRRHASARAGATRPRHWPPSTTSTPRSARSAPRIFQLQQTPQTTSRACAPAAGRGTELSPALGFDPAVRFSGLLDTAPRRPRRRPARGRCARP